MAGRIGNVLFVLGALVAGLCLTAVTYLVGWGEGAGAEIGILLFSTVGVIAFLIGSAIYYVTKA